MGLVRIRNRGRTDFEITLRLRELLRDRDLLALDKRQAVLQAARRNRASRDPDDQIPGCLSKGLGLSRLESGFLVDLKVLPVDSGCVSVW